MPSKSWGPPDEGRRSTQVAGPTKLVVCEGVVITHIQPTPNFFSSEYKRCCDPPGTAQLKTAVRVSSRSGDAMHTSRGRV